MNKKELLKQITQKFEMIRETLNYTESKMAERTGVSQTSYARYVKGKMVPGAFTLAKFGRAFGVSLDWLLLDRGQQDYEEKVSARKAGKDAAPGKQTENPKMVEIEDADTRKLVSDMALDPRLRYEVLLHYCKYKENRADTEEGKEQDKKTPHSQTT